MDKRSHKQRYDHGLKTRREVLGTGYVDKSQSEEVFLQVAIYCGVPAAVVGFRCAREVFKERGGA